MKARYLTSISISVCLLALTSCSTKYQDLLNDRDSQIQDLNSRLSEARSGLTDAERSAKEAQDALSKERNRKPADAGSSELDGLRKDIPEAEIRYIRGRISIGIDNTITFDSGKKEVKSGGEAVLRKVASAIKSRFPDKRIYIEGHTDTDPIAKTKNLYDDNVDLSVERALAVRKFMTTRCNVPERNLAVVGFGEHDPKDRGKGDASKSHNRRVEIVVGESL